MYTERNLYGGLVTDRDLVEDDDDDDDDVDDIMGKRMQSSKGATRSTKSSSN